MKAVVAAFNQEKALVGAFSVITNLRVDLRFKRYYKDGVRHGYYREFGPRYNYKPTLRSAGRYYRGVLRGWYWQVGCCGYQGGRY